MSEKKKNNKNLDEEGTTGEKDTNVKLDITMRVKMNINEL